MNEWITSIQPPVLMKMRYKMRCKSGGGASSTPAAEKSTKGSPSLEREGALRLVGGKPIGLHRHHSGSQTRVAYNYNCGSQSKKWVVPLRARAA